MSAISVLCLFVLTFALSQSQNCKCQDLDLCDAVQNHQYVVQGTVLSASEKNEVRTYNVKVLSSYKEKTKKKIVVSADVNDPCLKSLDNKETYLLFLDSKGKNYVLSSCFNQEWSDLSSADKDLVKRCSNMCPPVCEIFCPYGNVLDKNGCPTCECKCDDGTKPVQCLVEPCSLQESECREADTCENDYCGGCKAHYFDPEGKEICKKCPDVMCTIACEFGYVKDENGCNTCKCAPKPFCQDGTEPVACFQDPCAQWTEVCPQADECVANYCGGCHAEYFSQGNPVRDCKPVCGDVTCALFCQWGYQTDKNGCPMCACLPQPVCSDGSQPVECLVNPCDQKDKCPEADSCVAEYCGGCHARWFDPQGNEICKCPPVVCAIACEYGYVKDQNGCDTCECEPKPVCQDGKEPTACWRNPCDQMSIDCPEAQTCKADYCGGCNAHYFDAKGKEVCQCPGVMCAIACEYGYVLDQNGCPTCQCQPKPTCKDGSQPVACWMNPCDLLHTQCPEADVCVANYCGGCNAHYYDVGGHELCTCPPVLCDLACEFGNKKDKNGCPLCECQDAPVCSDGSNPVACWRDPCSTMYTDCPKATRCEPDYCHGDCSARYFDSTGKQVCTSTCPQVLCQIACENGFVIDPETGCETCQCKQECEPIMCEMYCSHGYETENGCPICKCKK